MKAENSPGGFAGMGGFFLLLGWSMTRPVADTYDLWTTELRVLIVVLISVFTLWTLLVSHEVTGHLARLHLLAAALVVYLTVSTLTGLVRNLGDREMPCVEWSADECPECVASELDANGINNVCTAYEWVPCEVCTARAARTHEARGWRSE